MASKPWYYPHDFEASYDLKIMALENELGLEGYARYFKTLEFLGRSGGWIPLSTGLFKTVLARELRATDEELETFLDVTFTLELFNREYFDETGRLASNRFSETYDKTQDAIDAKIRGGIKSGETRRRKALERAKSNSVPK